jgi:hypothetical protein
VGGDEATDEECLRGRWWAAKCLGDAGGEVGEVLGVFVGAEEERDEGGEEFVGVLAEVGEGVAACRLR